MSDTLELNELLAILHRDGGHYVFEHGREKAIADAKKLASILIHKEQALTDEVANLQDTLNTAGFLLADEKTKVARLREAHKDVDNVIEALEVLWNYGDAVRNSKEIIELQMNRLADISQLLDGKGPAE